MDTLFYKFIYEKNTRRSIKLLEHLHKINHPVSLKELEETTGLSKKVLKSTLICAEELLPDNLALTVENQIVMLENHSDQALEDVFIDIAKHTLEFLILEYAFSDGTLNVHELADKFFLAESTLRLRIKHMNRILSAFHCSISLYNIKIQGDETNIRYFYYSYFSEFQELFISSHNDELRYCFSIHQNIKKALEKSDKPFLHYSNQQISMWLLLIRDRLRQGHFVQVKTSFIERIKQQSYYQEFKIIYRHEVLKEIPGLEISEAESVWVYAISFNAIIYTRTTPEFELYRDEPDIALLKEKINILLEKVADELGIQAEQRKPFIYIHRAYLINLSILTEVSPLFQLSASDTKNYVSNTLELLYITWLKCLSKCDHPDVLFPIVDKESVATHLALISSQFAYNRKYQAKRILFSFEGEAGFVAYLEALATTLMPADIETIFIHHEPITPALLAQKHIDIIVCNYRMVDKSDNYIYLRMAHIPDIQEWTKLRLLITIT